MFKKISVYILMLCMLSGIVPCGAAEKNCEFLYNGEKWDTAEVIQNDGTYMVSADSLEFLGISVFNYSDGKRVLLKNRSVMVSAEAGSEIMYVNGEEYKASAAPVASDGKVFLPLEDTVSRLDYSVTMSENDTVCNVIEASEIDKIINNTKTVDGYYLSGELLNNPSFEGDFNYEYSWVITGGQSMLERVSDPVTDGDMSCCVSGRKWGWSGVGQTIESTLNLYGMGKYLLSGYIKTKDEEAEMTIKYNYTDVKGKHPGGGDVKKVNNTEWTYFEKVMDIEWEGTLTGAMFYAESTSAKGTTAESQDFYVDGCSLKRLMTKEEYRSYLETSGGDSSEGSEENEKYAELLSRHKDDVFNTVYPSESREILINPYKGLIVYAPIHNVPDNLREGTGDLASILYMRPGWNVVEPKEGEYQWDTVEEILKKCEKYGMQLGFSLGTTSNFNTTVNWTQATPLWVFDAGAEYTEEDLGGVKLKVPVYEDPIFREKMQTMIDSFAERFNYDERIAYVDMRMYGNYGEWHFYTLPVNREINLKRTNEQFFELIDLYKNVKLPTLTFVAKPAGIKYALEKYGSGVRGDGLMNPNEMSNMNNFKYVKNRAMSVGEFYDQYPSWYMPGGKYEAYADEFETLYERTVMETGVSAMPFFNQGPKEAYAEWKEFFERMANLLGYWYKPVKIEYPEDITQGLFKMRIKNDGVAPLYAGYDKKACMKLALADSSNNIIDTVTLDGFDPMQWQSGNFYDLAAEYKFEKTEGGTKLFLGMFTREENENPNVKLGIKADFYNGWYDISSMTKSDTDNKAHNKVYKAKELYADDNYGFRRPEYAFDDDMESYWANNCKAGNYLEIDFGEEKEVSEISLTASKKTSVKFLIQGFSNGRWTTLQRGSQVSTKPSLLKWRRAKAEKLRIVIDRTIDDYISLSNVEIR